MFSSKDERDQKGQNEDEVSEDGNVTPNLQTHAGKRDTLHKFREGPVARTIEKRTAQIPSDVYLWAAAGSIALSLGLQLAGRRQVSNFVGHWAPTFLVLGLYNKLVKVAGHDRVSE